jgi:hypothetical protein
MQRLTIYQLYQIARFGLLLPAMEQPDVLHRGEQGAGLTSHPFTVG